MTDSIKRLDILTSQSIQNKERELLAKELEHEKEIEQRLEEERKEAALKKKDEEKAKLESIAKDTNITSTVSTQTFSNNLFDVNDATKSLELSALEPKTIEVNPTSNSIMDIANILNRTVTQSIVGSDLLPENSKTLESFDLPKETESGSPNIECSNSINIEVTNSLDSPESTATGVKIGFGEITEINQPKAVVQQATINVRKNNGGNLSQLATGKKNAYAALQPLYYDYIFDGRRKERSNSENSNLSASSQEVQEHKFIYYDQLFLKKLEPKD
ncbi:unnamed protein product [Candida verbasci]|uniref:Uncharacterized protein n=1 Tax=Candida verbasci TaxID=1227364 RepID=A0A9W4TXY0_9ASCO|nr:unnamed protein product [Candida verbasci]